MVNVAENMAYMDPMGYSNRWKTGKFAAIISIRVPCSEHDRSMQELKLPDLQQNQVRC